MKFNMDVSIIIVNFNTKLLTEDVLNSIKEKTKNISYEVIVVDNNSTDGSYDYLKKKFNVDNIKIIRSSINLGFGRANNLGAQNSSGKYLFLLNSDTILKDNAIKIMYDYMEKNLDVGVCGGNLYNRNNEPIHSFGRELPSIWNEIPFKHFFKRIFLRKLNDFNYLNKVINVGYITGADFFIRKVIFDNLQGFDPDFFMYFEETELCSRIIKRGYKIVNIPTVKIIHLVGGSIEKKESKIQMYLESKYKYYEKVYGNKEIPKMFYISQLFNNIGYYLLNKKSYGLIKRINKEKYIEWKKKVEEKC